MIAQIFSISLLIALTYGDLLYEDFPYAEDEFYNSFPVPELQYNSSFPEPSTLAKLGQISGVSAINSSHILVFHRADRKWNQDDFDEEDHYKKQDLGPIKKPTIALFVDGKLSREFGAGLFFLPHSISVDGEGNIWTTDVALHQIFKFAKDDLTQPAMVLGERFKPGNDLKHFCKPTDIKIASNGDFFVSDGYCNSRVLKFDKNGSFLAKFGKTDFIIESSEELNIPHSLALVEDMDLLLVADRENQRVIGYSACISKKSACGTETSYWQLSAPVYGVAVDSVTKMIYALVTKTRGSEVEVLALQDNFEDGPTITGPNEQGLGMGHAISNIPGAMGFVVGSLLENCSSELPCAYKATIEEHGTPGLYLYEGL